MLILKLALKNIIGAGLRTWLNVFVLSIAFVAILFIQGMIQGITRQVMNDLIDAEYGGGQFWHRTYDPYDPLSIEAAHAPVPAFLREPIYKDLATPILITAGAIYPEGRAQSIMIKGVDPQQSLLNIPSQVLESDDPFVTPALIGTRMAKQTKLTTDDQVVIRWRDIHGTFDAADIHIVDIMHTNIPSIDSNQVWIPLKRMRQMLQAPEEASLIVLKKGVSSIPSGNEQWIFHDLNDLLKDLIETMRTKSIGNSFLYGLLLAMALLAIFDTQVLSIFRRRKEIGTIMALGMHRLQVIGLFTLEGALHGVLALILGAVYGTPLLLFTAAKGIPLPEAVSDMGVPMPNALYPSFGLSLVVGTTLLVLITVTMVSFLPTRKIAKLKPTDALRGKLS